MLLKALVVLSMLIMSMSVIFIMVVVVAPPSWKFVALLTVTPYHMDGPTVWMGILHSCARSSDSGPIDCTQLTLHPRYNFSVLSTVPTVALAAATPSHTIAACVCATLILSVLCWIAICWVVVENLSKGLTGFKNPKVIWLMLFGALCFIFGLAMSLVLDVVFQNAVANFNDQGRGKKAYPVAMSGAALPGCWLAFILSFLVALLAAMAAPSHVEVEVEPESPNDDNFLQDFQKGSLASELGLTSNRASKEY